MKPHKGNVVFDFDGVVNSYRSGWQGVDIIPDPPVEGIKECIDEVRAAGYRVFIVSSRCTSADGLNAINSYLKVYGIVVDGVCAEKPPAVVYIDDRAICFDGNPRTLLSKINGFRPWYHKGKHRGLSKIDSMSDEEIRDWIKENEQNDVPAYLNISNSQMLRYLRVKHEQTPVLQEVVSPIELPTACELGMELIKEIAPMFYNQFADDKTLHNMQWACEQYIIQKYKSCAKPILRMTDSGSVIIERFIMDDGTELK